MEKKADDDELERQAVAELMQEAKRGAERAKELGALGWMRPVVPSTNKNFLKNTLVSTLREPYGTRKRKTPSHHEDVKNPHRSRERSKSPPDKNHDTTQKYQDKRSKHKVTRAKEEHDQKPEVTNAKEKHDSKHKVTIAKEKHDSKHKVTIAKEEQNHKEKETKSKEEWDSSFSEEEQNIDDKEQTEKLTENKYIYDAYEYSYQAPQDPKSNDASKFKETNSGSPTVSSEKDTTDDKKKRHRRHSSSNNVKHERKKHSRPSSRHTDNHESKKHKKSKKKHKHKSKHKSKHD